MDRTPDRADPREHLDLDVLADAAEGLLDDGAARAVGDHLAGCAQCRARVAALSDVRDRLRALPDPELPPALAARLATVVDDARAADTAPERQPTLTVLADRRQRRATSRRHLAGWAAAVVVLVGAAFGVSRLGENDGSSASEGGGNSAGSAGSAAQVNAGPSVHETGRDYTVTSLKAAVPSLLAPEPRSAATSSGSAASRTSQRPVVNGDGLRRVLGTAQLAACSTNLGRRPSQLAAVDYARYGGAARVILVYRTVEGDRVDIYVVPDTCATDGTSLIPTTVLTDVPTS